MCLHSSHKLGWKSSLFPATDESQVSNKRWGTLQKLSWQCLQFKESSIIVTGKISFLPGLIDVAFLGWACHAGHLGRHAFEGIPEDAVCLRKNIQDWSRVDTFKLSYHDKSCPPEVTNWAGKAACFGQLMRAKSQTSVGVFKS